MPRIEGARHWLQRHWLQRHWLHEALLAVLICLGVFAVYMADRDVVQRADSIWTLQVAMSIIREGNANLDEIEHLLLPSEAGTVYRVGEHIYYWFPLGTALLIAPALALLDIVARGLRGFDLYVYVTNNRPDQLLGLIELAFACAIVALAAGVVYLLGREFLTRGRALLLVLVFAFCTPAWSSASRALWQHGPSILMLLLSLWFIVRARKNPSQVQFAGLFLALAYVIRPTNAIPVAVYTLYVLWVYPRMAVRYLLWAAPVAVAFMGYNLALYGAILPPYFSSGRLSLHSALGEALLGNLVSPSRGLFVYTPVFLLSLLGPYLKWRDGTLERLDLTVLATVVLHWVMISLHWIWWAGHSYGPRLFADAIPYFLYLLIPVIAKLEMPRLGHPAWQGTRAWLLTLLFTALASVSLFMNFQGATQPATVRWNWGFEDLVADVDRAPGRVWDWADPQFWRGLRPAAIGVRPEAYLAQVDGAEAGVQEMTVRLYNLGDIPLRWQALAPTALNFAVPADPEQLYLATSAAPGLGRIGGETSQELTLKFDAARYAAGSHSLGGILFQPLSRRGDPSSRGAQVVPVSLVVTDGAAAQDNQSSLIPPADIRVNGQEQTDGADLSAVFGAGWHDLEQSETAQWRWANSPAYLLIHSATERRAQMQLAVAAVYSPLAADGHGAGGTLRVALNGRQAGSGGSLSVVPGESAETALDLAAGWNVVMLELAEGSFRPVDLDPATGDSRRLSFALSEVNLVSE